MRLLFAHGWGYDAGVWAPLRAALHGLAGAADDRGYFGRAHDPAVAAPAVAIGHSLGALRLLAAGRDWAGLVAINGFDRFCGGEGVAPRVVDRMLARLAREPDATVRAFRDRCGDAAPVPAPDPERLRADLLLLRDGDVRGSPHPPLLLLDGGRDPILSPAHRAAGFPGHPRETAPDGGHLLPLTHPGWCATRIAAFAGTLAGRGEAWT